jgi:hypothetical protein
MNSTERNFSRARGMARWIKWPLLGALLSLGMARAALAAGASYVNNAVINYPLNVNYPPVIDATNFVNNNQFIINFTVLSLVQPFYETSDTVNFTNRGLMMANTGFRFDTQLAANNEVVNRVMAGSFYNSGTISCGSVNDLTATVFFGAPYVQFLVSATNIVYPGVLDVGQDGLIQFTGQNMDLTRSRLTLESSGPILAGTGYYGQITASVTNGNTIYSITPVWDPTVYLSANTAVSALVPTAPPSPVLYPFPVLYLTNSTAYFDIQSPTVSNNIISAVFIQDTSLPNVSYNVYFDAASPSGGDAIIEWAGSYLDAANGVTHSNYLYLVNDYLQSVSTNNGTLGGIPFNFSFTESPTPLLFQAPTPAGFVNAYTSGSVTNRYGFMNAQLIPGSASTNAIANLSVTNLPGRIEINASHELDLALSQISGPNYMSLESTNHFHGSAGASIQVPYSDLNLGVTNGFLTLSNLVNPEVPIWSGTCEAWSTRWTATSSNTVITVSNGIPVSTNVITITNDFRVLIIGSQFSPTAVAQVQDLKLHGTNLVISDAYNLMRTFAADAENLTLTTNGSGRGATSLAGELNSANPDIFWASSLPNLRNLTNAGAIRVQNLSQFIGTSNSIAVTPAVAASATLAEVPGRANVQAGNKVVIGASAYVFTNTLNNATANQVKIAATFDGTLSNLIAAINGAAGAGTGYSSGTAANPLVSAGPLAAHGFTVAARTGGSPGNTIFVANSTPTTNLVWSGNSFSNTLSGGLDAVTNSSSTLVPYRNFVNRGLVSDQGSQVWADNFESSGAISNGNFGSFTLQAQTATWSNGVLYAGGDVSITAASLVASNLLLQADRSLTLTATSLLTDAGVPNGNTWLVGSQAGSAGIGVYLDNGFNLPLKPLLGDLLGTTVTSIAPLNSLVNNLWAGEDRGASNAGYTNNVAIGRLVLDALAPATGAQFYFSGTGASNALYVDRLELTGYASYAYHDSGGNLRALAFNTNLVIYYADAVDPNYGDVSALINHKNNDHLRWVPTYAGYFSSTNLVYLGATNAFNLALAQDSVIDSDGDGIANASDPTPFFLPAMLNVTVYPTNNPPNNMVIGWSTIPLATNTVFYTTNLTAPVVWTVLTNFISPQPLPNPAVNVTVFDLMVTPPRYYQVMVFPWLTYPY